MCILYIIEIVLPTAGKKLIDGKKVFKIHGIKKQPITTVEK